MSSRVSLWLLGSMGCALFVGGCGGDNPLDRTEAAIQRTIEIDCRCDPRDGNGEVVSVQACVDARSASRNAVCQRAVADRYLDRLRESFECGADRAESFLLCLEDLGGACDSAGLAGCATARDMNSCPVTESPTRSEYLAELERCQTSP